MRGRRIRSNGWPVANIHPNPRNARRHSEAQLKIENLFREYGQTRPTLIDDAAVLIAGDGTCSELMVL